jgi:hypothetical protein
MFIGVNIHIFLVSDPHVTKFFNMCDELSDGVAHNNIRMW